MLIPSKYSHSRSWDLATFPDKTSPTRQETVGVKRYNTQPLFCNNMYKFKVLEKRGITSTNNINSSVLRARAGKKYPLYTSQNTHQLLDPCCNVLFGQNSAISFAGCNTLLLKVFCNLYCIVCQVIFYWICLLFFTKKAGIACLLYWSG